MGVTRERERGRVVAKRSAELEQVGSLAEMDRGERVAERVKARPGGVDLLHDRLEVPAEKVAVLQNVAVPVREGQRGLVLVLLRGEVGAQPIDERSGQRHLAPAVLRLRRLDPSADDRAPNADLRSRTVDLKVEALERDALTDPQAARRQHLEQQLVALRCHRQNRRKLLSAEHLDLVFVFVLLDVLAVRQRQPLRGVVSDQALAVRGRKRRAQRDRDVGDGRIAEALALLVLVGQPVHEAGKLVRGHVDQLQLGGEVRAGVVVDPAPVFCAGVLAKAATTLAAIALDPLIEKSHEAGRRRLLELAAITVGFTPALDPTRRRIGAGASLALLAGYFDYGDVADRLAIGIDPPGDAGGLGLLEPPLVAAAPAVRTDSRILRNGHELSPREPGAGRFGGAAPFALSDKTLTG